MLQAYGHMSVNEFKALVQERLPDCEEIFYDAQETLEEDAYEHSACYAEGSNRTTENHDGLTPDEPAAKRKGEKPEVHHASDLDDPDDFGSKCDRNNRHCHPKTLGEKPS